MLRFLCDHPAPAGVQPHEEPDRAVLTCSNSSFMNRLFIAFVCTVAALGGLLFGYDTAVISGAIGYMSRHFGMTPALEG